MIQIRQADNVTFSEYNATCNGSNTTIVSMRSCNVSIAILTSSPYSLVWGSSVFAQVSATNIKGTSVYSLAGNGAILVTLPSPPLNLRNNAAVTNN